MRQRVAICRALIYDPDILLMDEPFSALDAITRDEMNDALLDIWQRYTKTALFVTHSIREAVLLADRVLVMTTVPRRSSRMSPFPSFAPRTNEISETPEFMQICSYLRSLIEQGHGRRRQNPGTRATLRKSRVVQGTADEGDAPALEDRRATHRDGGHALRSVADHRHGPWDSRIHSASAIRRRAHARRLLAELLAHASVSGTEAVAAFLLATLLGFVAAAVLTYSPLLRDIFYPPIVGFQLIPKVALAPLFIVLAGHRVGVAHCIRDLPELLSGPDLDADRTAERRSHRRPALPLVDRIGLADIRQRTNSVFVAVFF